MPTIPTHQAEPMPSTLGEDGVAFFRRSAIETVHLYYADLRGEDKFEERNRQVAEGGASDECKAAYFTTLNSLIGALTRPCS